MNKLKDQLVKFERMKLEGGPLDGETIQIVKGRNEFRYQSRTKGVELYPAESFEPVPWSVFIEHRYLRSLEEYGMMWYAGIVKDKVK